jgi:pilus assembly protein FimV
MAEEADFDSLLFEGEPESKDPEESIAVLDSVESIDLDFTEEEGGESSSKDEALDALLADLESAEKESSTSSKSIKEDSFFGDLKSNKHNSDDSLEWDGELDNLTEDIELPPADPVDVIEGSEDLTDEDVDLGLSIADDGKLTVDEALAALDAQENAVAPANEVNEHDLTNFQKDNGFIDIDRLLNEADEEEVEIDQYKELDVDMGELDSLMGNASMVDVDDEENSVNAKLDLARAYIEIDDNDSANALLQEVKLDGNDKQKQEAEGLINSLT